jgi:hypothetical protein
LEKKTSILSFARFGKEDKELQAMVKEIQKESDIESGLFVIVLDSSAMIDFTCHNSIYSQYV